MDRERQTDRVPFVCASNSPLPILTCYPPHHFNGYSANKELKSILSWATQGVVISPLLCNTETSQKPHFSGGFQV